MKLYPQKEFTCLPVIISENFPKGYVSVMTEQKSDVLIETVKSYDFRWDRELRLWKLKTTFKTEPAADRAVEVGVTLLGKGFIVDCNDDIAARIKTNDWTPQRLNWVSKLSNSCFLVTWHGKYDKYYRLAKNLPGAKWNSEEKGIVVPFDAWRDVEDFAETLHFALSPGAKQVLEEKRNERVERITAITIPKRNESDGLSNILSSDTSVLPDLIDV